MIALTPEQRRTVEREFRVLASRWHALTLYRSNLRPLRDHPVYQELISLGEAAIPLILQELGRRRSPSWFDLLGDLTGEDPVPPDRAGHVAAMAEAWLEWGRGQGYLD